MKVVNRTARSISENRRDTAPIKNPIRNNSLRMGFSRKRAVMLVHLLALTFGLGILPVFWGNFLTAAILVIQSCLMLGIITFLQISLSGKPVARE